MSTESKTNKDFKNRVNQFFKEKYIGEILQLEEASLNRHYIKFKPFSTVYFQNFRNKIEIDSVDFVNNTISGFISNSSELKL